MVILILILLEDTFKFSLLETYSKPNYFFILNTFDIKMRNDY